MEIPAGQSLFNHSRVVAARNPNQHACIRQRREKLLVDRVDLRSALEVELHRGRTDLTHEQWQTVLLDFDKVADVPADPTR